MADRHRKPLDLRSATDEEITETFARGVRAALLAHKKAGQSIVVWDRERDHIVILRPDQIDVPDDPDEPVCPSETPSSRTPAPSHPD